MVVSDETKIAKIYMIYGLVDKDDVVVSFGTFAISGARSETIGVEQIRQDLDAALAATSAAQDALIDLILADFDKWWLKETDVVEDNGTKGDLLNIPAKFKIWRTRLASLLGVYVPFGGLVEEIDGQLGFGSGGSIQR